MRSREDYKDIYARMDNQTTLKPVQAHECFSACMGNIMASKYPWISGNEIVISGTGFRVVYHRDRKMLSTNMYHSNFRFLEKYNVKYLHDTLKLGDDPLHFVSKTLDAQKYLILRLDARQLTYDRVFRQAEHASHYVNLLAVRGDKLLLCDGYVPAKTATTYLGEVPCGEIWNAWREAGWEYYLFDDVPALEETEFRRDVAKELENSIRIYRQGGRAGEDFFGKNSAAEMFRGLDYLNRDRVFEVNYQLKIFGFLSLKQIVCEILKKNPNGKDALEEYEQILSEWNKICTFTVKIGLSSRKELYDALLERVHDCMEAEDKVLEKILNAGLHNISL